MRTQPEPRPGEPGAYRAHPLHPRSGMSARILPVGVCLVVDGCGRRSCGGFIGLHRAFHELHGGPLREEAANLGDHGGKWAAKAAKRAILVPRPLLDGGYLVRPSAMADGIAAILNEPYANPGARTLSCPPEGAILRDGMSRVDRQTVLVLLGRARRALGMSQREFGPALGASQRTAERWDTAKATPTDAQLAQLASRLLPIDAGLAAEAAAAAYETLESLGLRPPSPPTDPSPARPSPPVSVLVDAVVCAAAEAIDAAPAVARAALRAGFVRALALGLAVDDVAGALAGPRPTPSAQRPGKAARKATKTS